MVVDIENSHCYSNLEAVFQNVTRILAKDGQFVYADYVEADKMEALQRTVSQYFDVSKEQNISR